MHTCSQNTTYPIKIPVQIRGSCNFSRPRRSYVSTKTDRYLAPFFCFKWTFKILHVDRVVWISISKWGLGEATSDGAYWCTRSLLPVLGYSSLFWDVRSINFVIFDASPGILWRLDRWRGSAYIHVCTITVCRYGCKVEHTLELVDVDG